MELLAEPKGLCCRINVIDCKVELRRATNFILMTEHMVVYLMLEFLVLFSTKLICDNKIYTTDLMPFSFYGPTCDSLDYMKGPFYLPNDIDEGDLIEMGWRVWISYVH